MKRPSSTAAIAGAASIETLTADRLEEWERRFALEQLCGTHLDNHDLEWDPPVRASR